MVSQADYNQAILYQSRGMIDFAELLAVVKQQVTLEEIEKERMWRQ